MLGGYGQLSSEKIQTVINLDNYDYSHLKIEALFHFIDAWSGESAYLKIPNTVGGSTYLWTDSFDFTSTKNSLNLCGSETVGEGKFSTSVEAVIKK